MIWPGMGDPRKRKATLRYLAITAAVGIGVAAGMSSLWILLGQNDPLKVCINDKDVTYRVSATLEVYVDKERAPIPANVGFENGCQRSVYTTTDDGVIHAAWTDKYPFEIGHFLWMWDFPLREMQEERSKIFVNGVESPDFIKTPLVDGSHYRAEFITKSYDEFQEHDFAPPK